MSRRRSLQPWLTADIMMEGGDWGTIASTDDLDSLICDAVAALWREIPRTAGEPLTATLVFDTDAAVRTLNKRYRHIDKPTNVLSFPAAPLPHGFKATADEPRHIGDVVFALETVLREAVELGIPATHHLQHLTVHGLLHLLGFDHMTAAEAEKMEALETVILSKLGVPDPYADSEPLPP